jgi:hypothetical protein
VLAAQRSTATLQANQHLLQGRDVQTAGGIDMHHDLDRVLN